MSTDSKNESDDPDVDQIKNKNITPGGMFKLLPLEIQARIFSFISVEERVRVLETISGGQAAGQREQANFRRAVLESYKTVKNVKDFGSKWSKLRLLQVKGGLEHLHTRFPKLEIKLDGSELQGFIYHNLGIFSMWTTLNIVSLTGPDADTSVNIEPAVHGSVIFVQGIESASIMMIGGTLNKAVRLINLVDHSVRNCAPMLHKHNGGAAAYFNGLVYVVGDGGYYGDDQWGDDDDDPRCCERYNLESDSWERIADMNYDRFSGQLVIWNDSLYAVGGGGSGGSVERYDPENNIWAVVFNESIDGPLYYATTVVFEHTLYCCYTSGDHLHGADWKFVLESVDMRTGETNTNLREGLHTLEAQQYECGVYVMEDKVCLMQLCEVQVDGVGVKWRRFVLDRSQKWQCTDSGIIESMRLDRDAWAPLLL